MIDGTFQHQDNHGGGGIIENGATQYMTAGSGVLHIETPPDDLVMSGGLFHGIQATLFAQQLAARQQIELMRQIPPGVPGTPGAPGGTYL
jgi:redox-sensitive bicupin YhaK (pirin superfamily)